MNVMGPQLIESGLLAPHTLQVTWLPIGRPQTRQVRMTSHSMSQEQPGTRVAMIRSHL